VLKNLILRSLFVFSAFSVFNFLELQASFNDYIFPYSQQESYSNYGTVGVIQNPSARFQKEGSLALSWSHNDPYLRGSVIAYPFDWLEASFQYADINNSLYSLSSEFSGSQSLKDKSFDIKLRVMKETKYIPQIAIGFRDFAGTGLFSSEYLVASKGINNFDVSFGLGWGAMNGNPFKNPLSYIAERFEFRNYENDQGGTFNINSYFAGNTGFFAGIEYYIPKQNGLRLKAELDSTNYDVEGPKKIKQNSKINLGLVYPLSNNLLIKASYVRGNIFNFGFSYKLSLGNKNPVVNKKVLQNEIQNSEIIRRVTSRSDINLYRASLKYLRENEFYLQNANIDGETFSVQYAQSKYRNPAISSGRAARVLHAIAPDSITKIKLSEMNGSLGTYSLTISRDDLEQAIQTNITSVLARNSKLEQNFPKEDFYSYNPKIKYPKFINQVGPDLRSQIGGPDGFFFGDLRVKAVSEILFAKGINLSSTFSYGITDNMDALKLPSDSVLPHVRTDIVDYLKEGRGFTIERMQANYFFQPSKSVYVKLSGGILETMFSGIGGEILYRPINKNYSIGLEAWSVKQRAFDQMFDHRDYKTITGHITFYYHEPYTHILFKVKGGKYLAKDSGFTFDASRQFRSGLVIGAFFSLTDISFEEFGEGSFDKGFYFWVPIDVFSPRYSTRLFGWGLRPLTRDGAQSVFHAFPLWGVTNKASAHYFNRNFNDFLD
jgi:hypothetical protein